MFISTTSTLFVFLSCKIVYSSTWEELMQDHDGLDNAMSVTVPLQSAQDGYMHSILIGNNSQKFDVMITMRSSLLWVPKIGCKGSGSRKTYSMSPSFETDGRNWTQKSYGGTINGELGKDLVNIRSSASQQLQPKCTFGMATTISNDVRLAVDGVLGLAPITDSTTPGQPFITQIKNLLTSHMFTIFLSQQSGSSAGSLTYGSRNTVNCETVQIFSQPFTDSYQFKISSISLGNFTHVYASNAMPELIPYITGPPADIDGLVRAAGAKPGSYEILCNATIKNLEVKAGTSTYSIQPNRLIVKKGSGCVLALASQISGGFGPQWHFGAPLLQQYCITVNLNSNNLEFYGVKSGPTTTSSTHRILSTTPKGNITTSSTRTTRRILTTTPKKNSTSTQETTRRIPTTTPKRNITSSTRTTRRLPTTTPRRISTSPKKTTRRIISTTSRRNATTSRPKTTRRVLSTTQRRNVTTTRRFTTPSVRTTTKLAPTTYLYCLYTFMLFSKFFI